MLLYRNPDFSFLTRTMRSFVSRDRRLVCSVVVAVPLLSDAQAPAHNEKVPVIQGGAGPCFLEFTQAMGGAGTQGAILRKAAASG